MSKYKVGQKVKIKEYIEDGSCSSNGIYFNKEMKKYLGNVVTIEETNVLGSSYRYYYIKEDNGSWKWDEEWLEPYDEVKTKEDLKDGDVVTLRNGDRLLYCDGQFKDLTYPHHNGICDTYDIEDDLTSDSDDNDDIMKVERPLSYYEVFNREDKVREMTVEEISKALGYEVKIIKGTK